jgi:polysaccharide export outer membrane protein
MTKMKTFTGILLMSVCASAFGQRPQGGVAIVAQLSMPSSTDQVHSDRPALHSRYPRYHVMRDDVLALSFPLSPELNQTVTIQPDGYITLANAGSVYVQEMTVPEVVEAVKKAYSSVLHEPIIDVDLKDFQKPFFLVSGQVTKPGQYDLRYDMTVSQAIAAAGGFNPEAKTQVFLFHRESADWVEMKKLNIKDILHGKNLNEDAHVQPGDMIFVPEKFITTFKKYVPYSTGIYLNPSSALFP